MSRKSELIARIKRRLGYPMVKVEVDDTQIVDNINYARTKFIRYAAGHATQEIYFTMMLSGGQSLYTMPDGTVDVISYESSSSELGGINTLFTLGNFLYTHGAYGMMTPFSAGGYNDYNLISYHIAIDFLETINRYNPDSYKFNYHRVDNLLEISPMPATGNSLIVNDIEYDSPGYILVRATMIDGSTIPGWEGTHSLNSNLYESQWVEDYATARTKLTLGLIRRKFANFQALGNQGTTLDGSDLISEAKDEITALEDKLLLQEVYIGWPVIVGSMLLFLLNYSTIFNLFVPFI